MKFTITDDTLSIRFEGVEQVGAIKRRLVIQKADIARANWYEALLLPKRELGWRVGGAAIPGFLYAGRFVGIDGRNFAYLHKPAYERTGLRLRHVLVLELRNGRYRKLLFTVEEPKIAEQIIAWWSGNV